ncbi:GTPase [Microseira wollei]|uniref:tRNA modification GTPase MnmE n=1 Tax=Microseira wollei NIES-4236 TaxID=2530354 RepID=A0AAV3X956_9CYAN|nr:GTPase [Microseira wollei]GET37903.1 tRNA modification GTPase MnmE [Microseira wollei NIES-4236]
MLDALTQEKEQIISALNALPYSVDLPTDEQVISLEKVDIGEEVERDIKHLNESWEFFEEYRERSVIATIGMVNQGKSALANLILHLGESGRFEEAPIRQTSQPAEASLDEKTIIIDLPGLGSVLSEEDDQIVKSIVGRANLLLVVIGVNQPISKHLYDFLQSDEVMKTWDAQRIIIVLNKIDIWDSFPEAHRKKQMERYIKFLKDGDPDMDFAGINRLFDYDIPIIPFSVIHARYGIDTWREDALRQAIANALENSSNSCILRAEQELIDCGIKYSKLVAMYVAMRKKVSDIEESVYSLSSRLADDIRGILSRESDSLYSRLGDLKSSCFEDMGRCQPDSNESFWKGTYYQNKKSKMSSLKAEYQSKMRSTFDNFASNLREALAMLIRGAFGSCSSIYLPDKDEVYKTCDALIYSIWDAHDDVYFCNYSSSSIRVRDKLEQINGSLIEAIGDAIGTWKDRLIDQLVEAAQEAQKSSIAAKAGKYIEACNALNEFCEIFVETETFKRLLTAAQSST